MWTAPGAASAQEACAAQGTLETSVSLRYPGDPPVNATFDLGFDFGACIGSRTASGYISGNCGLSSGAGTTNTGRNFAFVGIGTALLVTGEINGALHISEDPRWGATCLNGNRVFLIAGALVAV